MKMTTVSKNLDRFANHEDREIAFSEAKKIAEQKKGTHKLAIKPSYQHQKRPTTRQR
jgi:hypothetical protein